MATIRTGEDYEKLFNADVYIRNLFESSSKLLDDVFQFLLKELHDAFSKRTVKGQTVLEIGSGPTIHCVISASNYTEEIYMSEYSERLIERLRQWLNGDIDIQVKLVEMVCQIENLGESVEERVDRIKKKVKEISFIDVTKAGSLTGSHVPKQFDIIISSGCLESAGQTLELYKTCVQNIKSLLKNKGYLILFGNLNCSQLRLDNGDVFPIINLSEEDIKQLYTEAGFDMISLSTKLANPMNVNGTEAVFFMIAQKNE